MGLDLDQLELTNEDNHDDELILSAIELPDSLDLSRFHDIREQGTCGSCYCFSALSAIEGQIAYRTEEKLYLSR